MSGLRTAISCEMVVWLFSILALGECVGFLVRGVLRVTIICSKYTMELSLVNNIFSLGEEAWQASAASVSPSTVYKCESSLIG
jgi:hypothetical protein